MSASDLLPHAPGDRVADRYRIEGVLGVGAMGAVYAATDERDGSPVALKVLLRPDETVDGRMRLLREAYAVSTIRHENVVRVLDVIDADAPMLVLERLHGETLGARVARSQMPLGQVAAVIASAASALAAAHELGIVHRDVKPQNIFLQTVAADAGRDFTVKILDFGLARVTFAPVELGGTANRAFGTPTYMSPEQVLGDGAIGPRADVWSLGVVAYECLTGVLPTSGASLRAVLRRILTGIWPIREMAPSLPDAAADAVDRMLVVDAGQRTIPMHEVAEIFSALVAPTNEPR